MKNMLSPLFIALVMVQCISSFAQSVPTDKNATLQTRNLYINMQRMAVQGVLLGHEDDLTIGFNGQNYNNNLSDFKQIIGEYPAVFGWDIGNIELDKPKNYWGVSFLKMAEGMKKVYSLGGINTISWLTNDPVHPGEKAKSKNQFVIRDLFSDPQALNNYRQWLDKLADYLNSLKGSNGEAIPVILRLFHEQTADWYWWGENRCTPDEYKKLFIFTEEYLRDKKGVHNVLYGYCTDRVKDQNKFLERYPGDEYVDIIGSDCYDITGNHNHPDFNFVNEGKKMVAILKSIGNEKNKPYAFMETGLLNDPQSNWWTTSLLPVIQNSGLSYILTWTNSAVHNYSPYNGDANIIDFQKFKSNNLIFQKDIADQRMYK